MSVYRKPQSKSKHQWPPFSKARRLDDPPRTTNRSNRITDTPTDMHNLHPPSPPFCATSLRSSSTVPNRHTPDLRPISSNTNALLQKFREFVANINGFLNSNEKLRLDESLCNRIASQNLLATVSVWNIGTHGTYPTDHCETAHFETDWFTDVRDEEDLAILREQNCAAIIQMITSKQGLVEIVILNAFFEYQTFKSVRRPQHPAQLMAWRARANLAVKHYTESDEHKRKLSVADWDTQLMGPSPKRHMLAINE